MELSRELNIGWQNIKAAEQGMVVTSCLSSNRHVCLWAWRTVNKPLVFNTLLLSILFLFVSVGVQAGPPPSSGVWTMTFEDEFNGTSLDTSVWSTGQRHTSYVNGEPQAYRPEAVSVSDGVCTITASKFSGFINQAGGYSAGTMVINVEGFPGAIPNGSLLHINNAHVTKAEDLLSQPRYEVMSTLGGNNPTQITIALVGNPTAGLQASVPDGAPVYLTFKLQNMSGYEWGALPYRSGMIQTYDKWTQKYGYYEARVKMSSAQGTWPAFWLLPDRGDDSENVYARTSVGNDWDSGSASGTVPMGNEIDVFEYMASWKDPATNISSSHAGYFWSYQESPQAAFTVSNQLVNPDTEFHTYGMYWGPDEIRFYVDGKEVLNNADVGNVGEIEHYMLLNMAMTVNDWTPFPSLDRLSEIDPSLPGHMEIDYVRVWSGTAGTGAYSGDIGDVAVAGSHAFDAGAITVEAGGGNISGSSDAFHWVGQPLAGNSSITVRVDNINNMGSNAKAGLMYRESQSDPGSPNVFLYQTSDGASTLQYRSVSGGSTFNVASASTNSPEWLRLVRVGNVFTAKVSTDGNNWNNLGSIAVTMSHELVAGLATASHNNGAVTTAVYESFVPNVRLRGVDIAANPWLNPGAVGTTSIDQNIYTLEGSGNGWSTKEDKGHFAYQQITGDVTITARVADITGGDQYWARAGVMIREDLQQYGRYVAAHVTPTSTRTFQWRGQTETTASQTKLINGALDWVKLVRLGNTFTGYGSSDGITWELISSTTLEDANEMMYVGLAVSSNDSATLATGLFEDVSINSEWTVAAPDDIPADDDNPPATGTTNVALNKPVVAFSGEQSDNPATNIVDGIDDSDSNRWSAFGFPHWVEIDLGADTLIVGTEVSTYLGRDYQFYVEARAAEGNYQRVVDRTANTSASPMIDTFAPVTARYVKITVLGANTYSGSWASLREFKVMGGGVSEGVVDRYVEAEDFENTSDVAPLEVLADSTASGGNYLAAPVSSGNYSAENTDSGFGTYSFEADGRNDVTIWVRGQYDGPYQDSFHYKVNAEGAWTTVNYLENTDWGWTAVATLSGLSAGTHTFYLLRREGGAKIDQIFFTSAGSTP